jgi:hypothetical protein
MSGHGGQGMSTGAARLGVVKMGTAADRGAIGLGATAGLGATVGLGNTGAILSTP